MKRTCSRIGPALSPMVLLWGALTGCLQAPDEQTPSATAPSASSQPADYVLAIDSELTARAFAVEPALTRVELRRGDGALAFEAQFLADPLLGEQVAYTYHPPVWEEGAAEPIAAELPLELSRAPSLEEAVQGAVLIHTQIESAVLGSYDSWGCDLLPGRFNWVASCGPKGGCCDAHDACYRANNCRAWSFASAPWTRCQLRCNAPVVACFTVDNPGPSECCTLGNCGAPR